MNTSLAHAPTHILALALGAASLLVVATALALRARPGPRSFLWIAVAMASSSLLAAAAALHAPTGGALRAAAVQLLAVVLALILRALIAAPPRDDTGQTQSGLSAAARAFAWLTLLGLPPTVGFHGRMLVCRALLAARWDGLALLAILGWAAALLPALRAIRSPAPAPLRGLRAALAIALMLAIALLGLYPGLALSLSELVAGSPAASQQLLP